MPGSLEAYLNQAVTDKFELIFHALPERAASQSIEEFVRSTFLFVGVIEHYQTSIDKLADLLKKPRVDVPHTNQSTRDEVIPNLRRQFRSVYTQEYEFFDLIVGEHTQRRNRVSLDRPAFPVHDTGTLGTS
jgi:hypothetical protein